MALLRRPQSGERGLLAALEGLELRFFFKFIRYFQKGA